MKHATWEEDGTTDQRLTHVVLAPVHYKKFTQEVRSNNFTPPNTESGPEEVFHCIKFRVKVGNGSWGAYQPWNCSSVLSIDQP